MNMRLLLSALWIGTMMASASAQEIIHDPYRKPKRPPFKARDIVQIVVVERAKALSTTDLRTDRRSRFEVGLDEWIRLDNGSGRRLQDFPKLSAAELADDPGIDLDARFRMDNTGRTSRAFDLTFTIAGEVMDVRPNGNLVIEARKRRQVNGETEQIRVSGEVSPSAVGVGNTVRSSDIVNLDIEYDGEGTAGDQAKPGWLSWILGKFWPF